MQKQSTNGNGPHSELRKDNETFKKFVHQFIVEDKRFVGMSRYLNSISFYWSTSIKTACAGAGFIFFNPFFWDKLLPEQQKTVVAHEIWHLILNHYERGEGMDPDSYNIAADHVINLGLQEDGFPIHKDSDYGGINPCCDPIFKGKSTEQIYEIVHKQRKKDPKSHKTAEGTPSKSQIEDLIKSALDGTSKDIEDQLKNDEKLRNEAINSSLNSPPGTQKGGEERILYSERKKIFIKEATYEEIFAPWLIDPLSGGKRTYLKPSRRQMKDGLRLKGRYPKKGKKNRLTHLVYALDVSGSISREQANMFLKSAKTLKEKLNPSLMTIILWDTEIRFEKVFREDEPLDNIKVIAGGGTSLGPVYKRVKQINPEALVIFTDLAVNIPPKPSWETIWFVPFKNIIQQTLNAVTYGDIYTVPKE